MNGATIGSSFRLDHGFFSVAGSRVCFTSHGFAAAQVNKNFRGECDT